MLKFNVILLGNDLRSRLLPSPHAARMIAVRMREDDVFDRRIAFGLQQLLMPHGIEGYRSVNDDIARAGRDEKRVAKANGLKNRFVNFDRFLLVLSNSDAA